MLVESILRVGGTLVPMSQVVVVTGPALASKVEALVSSLGVQVLVEPEAKSTGPCIAWAAHWIAGQDPDAVLSVFPADHVIDDVTVFRQAAEQACRIAEQTKQVVTLGIKPDRPATGFGYIQRAGRVTEGVYSVARFVEKPAVDVAKTYVASGDYYWNAGMFFMRAASMMAAIGRQRPQWLDALKGGERKDAKIAIKEFFSRVESVSIDVAIMEPEGHALLVIPVACGWCDLGSWSALLQFQNHGTNFVKGEARLVDVEGSVVVSEGARVTVLGLEGVCVAVSGQDVLVADLKRDQDVRSLVPTDGTES